MFERIRTAFSSFKFRSLFFRILMLLLVLVMIPVLFAGVAGLLYSKTTIRKEVEQSSVQMLEQTRRLMDVLLNDINDWSLQLAQSEFLMESFQNSDPSSRAMSVEKVKSELLDLYINSPYVESVYVLYSLQNEVLSPLSGLSSLDDEDLGVFPSIPFNIRLENPWIVQSAEPAPHVSLVRAIPVMKDRPQGAIIVNMNQQGLFQSPSLRWMREGEEIWMVSPDGEHAFSNKTGFQVEAGEFAVIRPHIHSDNAVSFTQTIRGERYAFTSVGSPYTQWKYVDVIPVDMLYQRIGQLETIMLGIAALAIGGSIILAFLGAAKIYSPIYSLFDITSNRKQDWSRLFQKEKGSELGYLAAAMKTMDEHATKLESRMKEHLPVLQHGFLHSLLQEKSTDTEELLSRFAYYQLKAYPFGFFVYLIRIDHYPSFTERYNPSDQSLISYFIAKLTEELFFEWSVHALPVYSEGRDFIVIGNLTAEEQISRYHMLSIELADSFHCLVQQYLPVPISIGIGDLKASVGNICESFEEAKEALEIRAFRDTSSVIPIWLERRERQGSMILLDRLREIRQFAIAHLRNCEHPTTEEVLRLLRELVDDEEGRLPFAIIQHAVYQLLVDIVQRAADFGLSVSGKWDLSRVYEEIMIRETADQIFEAVASAISEIKQELSRLPGPPRSPVIRQVMEYIHANYHQDISLGGIADQLHLDASHVSRLFRQEVQTNFMDYLISIRIGKAKELLVQRKMPIKDIGTAIGYSNPRSFNRIFKKYEGVTPGDYRELNAPAKLDIKQVY